MQVSLQAMKKMLLATFPEGRLLGGIQELYFDAVSKKLAGLTVKGKAEPDPELIIGTGEIRKVGRDVIFLSAKYASQKSLPSGQSFSALLGMPISGKDGKALGELADIVVDDQSWETVALKLKSGAVVTIDFPKTVFGRDMILVQAGAKAAKPQPPQNQEDLLTVLLGKDFLEKTSQAVQRGETIVQQTSENIKQAFRNAAVDFSQPRPRYSSRRVSARPAGSKPVRRARGKKAAARRRRRQA